MVIKNCISNLGLSQFPNNSHEAILLMKRDISQENTKSLILANSPHMRKKYTYSETILFCAFNVLKFKLCIHLFM